MQGFDFLIAVIGLFGIGEILLSMEEGLAFHGTTAKINLKVVLETWKTLPRYWMTFIRSTADRLLDGHHAGRRDAGVVHELRRRQEDVQGRGQVRRPASSRASSRPRPPRTRQARARCCR